MRNVREKIAAGEPLDDDDVQWAADRGIALPEEYGVSNTMTILQGGTTPLPVAQTGPAYAPGPDDFTTDTSGVAVTILDGLPKKALQGLAKAWEVDGYSSMNKEELITALIDAASGSESSVSAEEDEGEDE